MVGEPGNRPAAGAVHVHVRNFIIALLLLAAAVPVTGDVPRRVRIGGISWYTDYDFAMRVARQENKPLWLHFGENPG